MANFSVEGLDDLMKELDSLDIDRIAPVMLEEAVPILERNEKNRASAHKETGENAEIYQTYQTETYRRRIQHYSTPYWKG